MEYNWDDVFYEIESVSGIGAALLLYKNSVEMILETTYELGCLSPEKLFVVICDPTAEVTEELLYIISKADRLLYKKDCTYIVYDVEYFAEVRNIYKMIVEKLLGRKVASDISILDHVVIVEKDED